MGLATIKPDGHRVARPHRCCGTCQDDDAITAGKREKDMCLVAEEFDKRDGRADVALSRRAEQYRLGTKAEAQGAGPRRGRNGRVHHRAVG